jgi:uracil phosphoribosyltransferase
VGDSASRYQPASLDSNIFKSMVIQEHGRYISADFNFSEIADNWKSLEKQNTPDKFFRMLLDKIAEFIVSPVFTHLGMHHVLVDRCKLICQ